MTRKPIEQMSEEELKRLVAVPPGEVVVKLVPRKRRRHFVQVPGTWIERLARAHFIATYRVALHVLYRHWKGGGAPFALSNGAMLMEGVARGTKWRALYELEQLGLIAIERRKRKSPRITAIV